MNASPPHRHRTTVRLRGLALAATVCAAPFLAGACVEPPYRTEIVSVREGGVDIKHVPKDHVPPPAPAEAVAAEPVVPLAPAPAGVAPPPSVTPGAPLDEAARQKRLEELEAQSRALNAEIRRLKQQEAAPATAP